MDATELEAMCKEDSSWYPCQVSLSSTEDSLVVEFGRQEFKDMVLNKDEALTRVRFRSVPLEGDDCSHIEGKHVLAINKSQFKTHFHDAKVEKVHKVRHSSRVYCRCTFMIQWLHQELKGKVVTVPSQSIMKLASKSITVHPTVAVFLKSVKQMGLDSASPFPVLHNGFDDELDFNKLLEKQVEEINISANGFRKEITVDMLEEAKADTNGHIQHKLVAASKVSISHAQNSHDQDQLEGIAQSTTELEVNIEDDGLQAPCSSIQEQHSECRSHLSPLSARAALALLVSSTHKNIAIGGTELFNSCESDNICINKLSSEVTKVHKDENKTSDASKTCTQVEKVSEIQNGDFDMKGSAEEIKSRAVTNQRRLTRSVVQEEKDNSTLAMKQGLEESKSSQITETFFSEGNATIHETNLLKKKSIPPKKKKEVSSPVYGESGIPMEESSEKLMSGDGAIQDIYVPRKSCAKYTTVSTNMRRLTRSAIQEKKDKSNMAIEQELEESKSAHGTRSRSSEGDITLDDSNELRKKNKASKKKKAVSLVHSAENDIPMEENNEMLMSGDVEEDTDAAMETCAKETQSMVSKRLTRSSLSSKEDLEIPEARTMEKETGGSRKKKAVSPSSDKDSSISGNESSKKDMSGAVRTCGNICQSEGTVSGSGGNSKGQKRKSSSSSRQELRFSPRLRFLPRTRSQNKS